MMPVAIVGAGYVADFYVNTLRSYPALNLVGVTDRDTERASRFATHHGVRAFASIDEMFVTSGARIVVNLTDPRNHANVTRRCLEAGIHIYSEKPMAMDLGTSKELVELAHERGLHLSSAPCTVLGTCAQTVWRALQDGRIGQVHLVYAELDDGMIHTMNRETWRSEIGTPWPAKDEFEVGCTLEHAGYYVTWLAAFFGPAASITASASTQIANKRTGEPAGPLAPDISVAVIRFHSGVVARLTCSVIAQRNHRLQIFGERGTLKVEDCWYDACPVYLERETPLVRKMRRQSNLRDLLGIGRESVPAVRHPRRTHPYQSDVHALDYAQGVADLAEAIRDQRPPKLSAAFCLHCNEMALAIQDPAGMGCPYEMTTLFEPLTPGPPEAR